MSPARPFDPSTLLMRFAQHSAPMLEPLATHGSSSRAIGAFTTWEAQWRRAAERQQRMIWHSYGLVTRTEVARSEERLAAVAAGGAARPRVPISWREGGKGSALVLINGWTASGLVWPSAWIAELEQRFHVIRPDNRGSGWSRTALAPFTIGDMAKDVAAVLRACNVKSAVVVGLSMGGMIAQELALRHPDLLDRLVIVGSQPPAPKRIASPTHTVRRMLSAPEGGALREHIAAAWADVCGPGFADAHPELLDKLASQVVARVTPRALLLQQMRAISGWSGAHRLARIAAPTVVVHGDADRLMPLGNGMRLAQLIPNARYVELPGVGHLVPLEAPEELAALIDSHPAHT